MGPNEENGKRLNEVRRENLEITVRANVRKLLLENKNE